MKALARFPWIPLFLCLTLWPSFVDAQVVSLPTLVMVDSRGEAVGTSLTIGRSLFVGLDNATPGQGYDFQLLDEIGSPVAVMAGIAKPNGEVPLEEFWGNTGIPSCVDSEGLGDFIVDGKLAPVVGPFNNVGDAVLTLNNRTWTLQVSENTSGSTLFAQSITLEEPQTATYYWSDGSANKKCFYSEREKVYLSVYKGDAESFNSSRVFMFHPPNIDTSICQLDIPFTEKRIDPTCASGVVNNCRYIHGTPEAIPETTTIELTGPLPEKGQFLAIVRQAPQSANEERFLQCDRVTDETMSIRDDPVDLTDSGEDWGCLPCPPPDDTP